MRTQVAIIGAGYVGLPLAVAFAEAGHAVLCVEPDAAKSATAHSQRGPLRPASAPACWSR